MIQSELSDNITDINNITDLTDSGDTVCVPIICKIETAPQEGNIPRALEVVFL